MKVKFFLVACALVIASTVNAQTPNVSVVEQWQRFTIEGEEFSVKLPMRPAVNPVEISAPPRPDRVERVLLATSDGVFFAVYGHENPQPQQSLADFVAERTAYPKAKLKSKRKLEVNGFAGHEYKWVANKIPRTEQFFATKQHLYHFIADGGKEDDETVKQFFASITLGKDPEGIVLPGGPGPDGEKIYTGKEVDQKARVTKAFPPAYTEEARKNQIKGVVVVKVVLSSTGRIARINVVSGLPFGLTESAIAAVRKLQFVPAVKDGKNVSMWMQLEYNFNEY